MAIQKGSYVVAKVDKKNLLLRVDSTEDNGDIICTIEKTRHLDPEKVSIRSNEILAQLGKDPKSGSVHGVTIETWKSSFEHEVFGTVNVFHELETEHNTRLLRSFDKAGSLLKKHGLTKFLPCNMEIRVPKGKVAGHFKYSGKDPEEHPDTLTIRPNEKEPDFVHILLHESGHANYFRNFRSKKGRASWVKIYHDYITVTEATQDDICSIVDTYLLKNSPSDAKSLMSEEELVIFDEMMDYVKRIHKLDIKDLDCLFEGESELAEFWPTSAEVTSKVFEITEYALKNQKEMFAECFALFLAGKKLPSKIHKLMEKSLSVCANS